MGKYTTSVRSICEVNSGLSESVGQSNVNDVIANSRDKIFDFYYPIYDEEYRPILENKILKHYYTREIGAETVGLWKLFLDTRMNEIMPYYNKLYESELLRFNPLYDVDYTREYQKTGEETGVESSATHELGTDRMSGTIADNGSSRSTDEMDGTVSDSGITGNTRTDNLTKTNDLHTSDTDSSTRRDKNDHWDYYSDTPQGSVGNLENLTYLTNARHVTDDGNGSTSSSTKTGSNTGTVRDTGTVEDSGTSRNTKTYDTTETLTGTSSNTRTYNTTNTKENNGTLNANKTLNSTDEYIEHVVGKMSGTSYMKMIKELRENILNIDMLIIRDLNDLFFGLWE